MEEPDGDFFTLPLFNIIVNIILRNKYLFMYICHKSEKRRISLKLQEGETTFF